MAATGANQSSNLTATFTLTGAFEAQMPFQVQMSAVSNDPIIDFYPSMNGGATFDTVPLFSFSISRISGGGTAQSSISIPTGIYAIKMTTSGPDSQQFAILTQQVMTAYINV